LSRGSGGRGGCSRCRRGIGPTGSRGRGVRVGIRRGRRLRCRIGGHLNLSFLDHTLVHVDMIKSFGDRPQICGLEGIDARNSNQGDLSEGEGQKESVKREFCHCADICRILWVIFKELKNACVGSN
jgi:hypothetical protein